MKVRLFGLILLTAFTSAALGQTSTGEMSITGLDPTSAVVPAAISIKGSDTGNIVRTCRPMGKRWRSPTDAATYVRSGGLGGALQTAKVTTARDVTPVRQSIYSHSLTKCSDRNFNTVGLEDSGP